MSPLKKEREGCNEIDESIHVKIVTFTIETYKSTEAHESGLVTVMPAVYFVNFPRADS